MIGRSGERGSGISVLVARHDDDDDDICKGCPCGIVSHMLGCNIIESEFKLQLRYYIHFQTYTLGKGTLLFIQLWVK